MARHHFTTVLDEFGINKSSDYLKLSPDRRHYFEELLFKSINKETGKTLDDIRVTGGVKFHFKTGLGARNTPTNAFLAKSAFYANKTLITYPFRNIEDKRELEEFKSKNQSTREVNRTHRIYVDGPPSRAKKDEGYKLDVAEFREFLDLLIGYRPAIESGIANVLPLFPDIEKKVRNKKLGLISANFNSRELHKQFFEVPDSSIIKRESSPIVPKLLLPHFGNIPLKQVLEIREKEKKLHDEFQRRLETLLMNASQTDSESVIFNYMRDVDAGVKELHRKFKEIQTRYRWKNTELVIGFILARLMPFVPITPEIQHVLSAILSATAFQFFTVHKEFRTQVSSLRDDQFYIHWRVFRKRP